MDALVGSRYLFIIVLTTFSSSYACTFPMVGLTDPDMVSCWAVEIMSPAFKIRDGMYTQPQYKRWIPSLGFGNMRTAADYARCLYRWSGEKRAQGM
jgi:hypothetical protein